MSIEAVLSGARQWCVHVADVLAGLRLIPDNSIHCCVTSPPYYGLRDYGLPPSIWGGDPECEHLWGDEVPGSNRGGSGTPTDKNGRGENYGRDAARGSFCRICNAWRGCFGLEPTPQLYVEHAVLIFREVRRVLRPDGTFWLNIGDSYCNAGSARNGEGLDGHRRGGATGPDGALGYKNYDPRRAWLDAGIKQKDLVGVPWMLAFALRDDGWWLRSEIIWDKPNAMPDSCEDRPTKSHEQIFLLTKSATYFYDHVAIFEPFADARQGCDGGKQASVRNVGGRTDGFTKPNGIDPSSNGGRNKRSVWHIPVGGYREAHFATFPIAIPETCLKAGTSSRGCCGKCGQPWERVTEDTRVPTRPGEGSKVKTVGPNSRMRKNRDPAHAEDRNRDDEWDSSVVGNRDPQRHVTETRTVGWQPGCKCNDEQMSCVCLDPFNGAATTGLVAVKGLNLRYIGLELNETYAEMSRRRIEKGFVEDDKRQPSSCVGQQFLFS